MSFWFAARPSGTENIYKLYAESLKSAEHLTAIVSQAQEIVLRSLAGSKSYSPDFPHDLEKQLLESIENSDALPGAFPRRQRCQGHSAAWTGQTHSTPCRGPEHTWEPPPMMRSVQSWQLCQQYITEKVAGVFFGLRSRLLQAIKPPGCDIGAAAA